MSRATVVKPCAMDAALAVRRASEHLQKNGYESEAHADGKTSLRYVRGTVSALFLQDSRHHVELSADGKALTFVFTLGLAGGGFVTQGEQAALDARAAEAARASLSAAPRPPRVGCRQCGQMTRTDVPACERCGSDAYY